MSRGGADHLSPTINTTLRRMHVFRYPCVSHGNCATSSGDKYGVTVMYVIALAAVIFVCIRSGRQSVFVVQEIPSNTSVLPSIRKSLADNQCCCGTMYGVVVPCNSVLPMLDSGSVQAPYNSCMPLVHSGTRWQETHQSQHVSRSQFPSTMARQLLDPHLGAVPGHLNAGSLDPSFVQMELAVQPAPAVWLHSVPLTPWASWRGGHYQLLHHHILLISSINPRSFTFQHRISRHQLDDTTTIESKPPSGCLRTAALLSTPSQCAQPRRRAIRSSSTKATHKLFA